MENEKEYLLGEIEQYQHENKELKAKVKHYEQFIINGVDGGYIKIPDKIDPAYFTIIELTKINNNNS